MIEKYFSELLNKTFDTKEECLEAEKAFEEKHKAELQVKEERAARRKEVEKLYEEANEARKKADEALAEFLKKYKHYHSTVSNVPNTKTIFDVFFDNWF